MPGNLHEGEDSLSFIQAQTSDFSLCPQAQEQGPFDPDPTASNAAHLAENAFLTRIGYTK
jgi:hypothetical protein